MITPPEVTTDIYYILDVVAYWKNEKVSPSKEVSSTKSITMNASSYYTVKLFYQGIGDLQSTKFGWKVKAKPDGSYETTSYHYE